VFAEEDEAKRNGVAGRDNIGLNHNNATNFGEYMHGDRLPEIGTACVDHKSVEIRRGIDWFVSQMGRSIVARLLNQAASHLQTRLLFEAD
jgi:hypothetical protein